MCKKKIKLSKTSYLIIKHTKRKDFDTFIDYWNNKYVAGVPTVEVTAKTKKEAIYKLIKQLYSDSKSFNELKYNSFHYCKRT